MRIKNSDFFKRNGYWVTAPYGKFTGYVFYRRKFELKTAAQLHLLVSADCRYQLFLDGKLLGRGPVRGDLEHYHCEIYDEELSAGEHELLAEVVSWHGNYNIPWAEIHFYPAFLALGWCGDIALDTPGKWECASDGFRRLLCKDEAIPGCPYEIPAALTEEYTAMDSDWRQWDLVKKVAPPCFADNCETDPSSRWKLRVSEMPQMQSVPVKGISLPFNKIGSIKISEAGVISGILPAGRCTVLVDLGKYYTFIPSFNAVSGKGCCRMAYGESLCDESGKRGDRGVFADGIIDGFGCGDKLIFRGGKTDFIPFWYRAGRFVELSFDLQEPLILKSLSFAFTAYPLERKVEFHAPGDTVLDEIFETAWHTARCCIHEHYEDCPYWEQLQYAGDTRIQALVSYIGANDPVPGRQAIRQFDHSRIASGLTASRYPANFRQIIPEYSLFWILMIEDHYTWFKDISVITEHWDSLSSVLLWFENLKEDSGLIGHTGYWNFTDWSSPWEMGKSSRGEKVPETIINMIYADACRAAEYLGGVIGKDVQKYSVIRQRVIDAVNNHCYSARSKLYTDVPGKNWFSQHVNAWAILCGAADIERHDAIIDSIMNDSRLSQCTLYFAFYILEALRRTGRYREFRKIIEKWEKILQMGFTTFPEAPSVYCRSDCHGWSAGVFYQLLMFNYHEHEINYFYNPNPKEGK